MKNTAYQSKHRTKVSLTWPLINLVLRKEIERFLTSYFPVYALRVAQNQKNLYQSVPIYHSFPFPTLLTNHLSTRYLWRYSTPKATHSRLQKSYQTICRYIIKAINVNPSVKIDTTVVQTPRSSFSCRNMKWLMQVIHRLQLHVGMYQHIHVILHLNAIYITLEKK